MLAVDVVGASVVGTADGANVGCAEDGAKVGAADNAAEGVEVEALRTHVRNIEPVPVPAGGPEHVPLSM